MHASISDCASALGQQVATVLLPVHGHIMADTSQSHIQDKRQPLAYLNTSGL